jgi:serine/threonine-protein kinase
MYENLKKIDEGGQATIYLADDVLANRKVILKFIKHNNPGSLKRLKREARLATEQLGNAFTVDLLADCTDKKTPFLVFEYCSGGSLAKWIFDRQPPQTVTTAMLHGMMGLQGIHNRGGFHGDFTPRNLLIAHSAGGWRIKLIDFGLGQTPNALSGNMTRHFRGTPNYIAPEIERGDDYTWRADIYSAGIVFRELLTGVRMKLSFDFNPPPFELNELIDSMTSEDPRLRPTADEIMQRLQLFLAKAATSPVRSEGTKPGLGTLLLPAAALLLGILATKNEYDSNASRYRNHRGQFASGWFG